MAEIKRPVLNRIPGMLMPAAQREKLVKDVTKLTRLELLDIKEREGKLLSNKAKLACLPDKGKRIQIFYDKVVAELERRSNIDEAAALFSELNIAASGQKSLNELEWQGRLDANGQLPEIDPTEDVLDSDDEIEMDPLKIIAQRTMHESRIKVLPPEPQLITEKDLEEIKSFQADNSDSGVSASNDSTTNNSEYSEELPNIIEAEIMSIDISKNLPKIKSKLKEIVENMPTKQVPNTATNARADVDVEQHVRYLVEMTEQPKGTAEQREKFKPYKTTKTNVHAPEKERTRKQGKYWELTAATPPPIQHNGVQMLTLMDSVEIQTNYLAKMRELQEEQAAARLTAKIARIDSDQRKLLHAPDAEELKSNPAFTKYRSPPAYHIEGVQILNENDEVHDTLDDEKSGGISYTVYE